MTTSRKPRQMPVVRHGTPGAGLRSVAPLAGLTRPEPKAEEPQAFDPSEHNIDDVKAHVGAHPDELDAVLAAERDGKDRSTLVEWLESHQEPTTEPS